MEYSKKLLGQFKKTYFYHGKYNLGTQVFHLARLAEFYERKYSRITDWPGYVKAHALYNSISCRKPEFLGWKKQAFSVQQEYFGASSSYFTFEQQQKLTASLKKDLEEIRNQTRDNMKTVHTLASNYQSCDKVGDNAEIFFDKMKSISVECSNCIAKFAKRIISECVEILKPVNPPCDFEVLALGSIAKGETTPYSDLEYLFLIEDQSPRAVKYFETLAVMTYFQIGNLGETKLKYMAIEELEGWFEDQAKNGFKIDGLSDQAGNIPTGNGTPTKHNHFITTPEKLGERYRNVLHNPDKDIAIRGDLTAMMKYMKPIFSHRNNNNRDLLKELNIIMQSCEMNQERKMINLEMLYNDMRKYSFTPDHELRQRGCTVDAKREIYRFPSILLLDIAVMTETTANDSWESLQTLGDNKEISAQLHFNLKFILAAAIYIRLSAYLHHDSQDDRISLSKDMSQSQHNTPGKLSTLQGRSFAPSGNLFLAMCSRMIRLKQQLAKTENIAKDLRTLALDYDDRWPHIRTLHYTGREREAFLALKELYGESLCDDPISVTQNLPPGQSEFDTLNIISETLLFCDEYRLALVLYKHMTDNDISDQRRRIADCYIELGDYDEAVTLLEAITDESAHLHYSLGRAYAMREEYRKSERSFVQALELFYHEISREKQYDYYGEPIESFELTDIHKISFTTITSPEQRLTGIIKISHDVISCVSSLGSVYSDQGQYKLAESYFEKGLSLISELYGEDAAVTAVDVVNKLGDNYRAIGRHSEAEDRYKQALDIYRNLPEGAESSDIAHTLIKLGNNYRAMGQNDEAEDYCKQALAIYRRLSQGSDSRDVAHTLNNLGNNYTVIGQYIEAEDSYKQALATYRKLSKGTDSIYTARTLYNLGISYNEMGKYSEAVDSYKQALAIHRNSSQGAENKDIANTLNNLGANYRAAGDEGKAVETLREALDMYSSIDDPGHKQINILLETLNTGSSGVTDSPATGSTSNSDTQISTYVTPTSSDTDMQSTIYHTETLMLSHDSMYELFSPQYKYRRTNY